MGDEKDISVKAYNGWSRRFEVQRDDGDGIPTGRDVYVDRATGQVAPFDEVAGDVFDFYREQSPGSVKIVKSATDFRHGSSWFFFVPGEEICTYMDSHGTAHFNCGPSGNDSWVLYLNEIAGLLPAGVLDLDSTTHIDFSWDPAYFLAAYFAYRPDEEIDRFIAFLKNTPIPPARLLEMERTARARGNYQLGMAIHKIFESRNPGDEFLKLDVEGSGTIYIERGSTSEKAWLLACEKLADERERGTFAMALDRFVSVEIADGVEAESLRRFANEVPINYQQGLPMPPHIRLTSGEGLDPDSGEHLKSGNYDSFTDTVSVDDWGLNPMENGVLTHELAHFLIDLMDDKDGPNRTFHKPKRFNGEPLFDPQRCDIDESISSYGGTCDKEREHKSGKDQEDPAETITYVILERMGKTYKGWERFSLQLTQEVITWLKDKVSTALSSGACDSRTMDGIVKEAEIIGNVAFPPPERKGDDRAYLERMARWIAGLEKKMLPAQRMRDAKIAWARRVLDCTRTQGFGAGPNPHYAPWDAAANPYRLKPADEPLVVMSTWYGLNHYMVIGKSREEGEHDLRALTLTSRLEEAWVFVEAEDASGKIVPIWFEIGFDETPQGASTRVPQLTSAISYTRELGFKPLSASEYHIHPQGSTGPKWADFASGGDYIQFYQAFFVNFYDLFKDEGLLSFDDRIVTPKGVWRFAKKEINARGHPGAERGALAVYADYLSDFGRPMGFLSHIPILSIFAPRKVCAPEEAASLLSTDLVDASFQPF